MKITKNLLASSFLIFILTTASCQKESHNFEGIIMYFVKYESTSNEISAEFLRTTFGDTAIVYMKDGKYKQVYPNAKEFSEVIYDDSTNNYYLLKPGIDTLFFANMEFTNDKFSFMLIKDADSVILGYKCKIAQLVSMNCDAKYYYAPDLPLSPDPFKRHKIGGYDILTKNIISIYLAKYEIFKGYNITTKAYFIKRQNLQDSIFSLPSMPLRHY